MQDSIQGALRFDAALARLLVALVNHIRDQHQGGGTILVRPRNHCGKASERGGCGARRVGGAGAVRIGRAQAGPADARSDAFSRLLDRYRNRQNLPRDVNDSPSMSSLLDIARTAFRRESHSILNCGEPLCMSDHFLRMRGGCRVSHSLGAEVFRHLEALSRAIVFAAERKHSPSLKKPSGFVPSSAMK